MKIFEGPEDEFNGLTWMKDKVKATVNRFEKEKEKADLSADKSDRLAEGSDLHLDVIARLNEL